MSSGRAMLLLPPIRRQFPTIWLTENEEMLFQKQCNGFNQLLQTCAPNLVVKPVFGIFHSQYGDLIDSHGNKIDFMDYGDDFFNLVVKPWEERYKCKFMPEINPFSPFPGIDSQKAHQIVRIREI